MHRITIESKDARALANELESRIRSFNECHSGPLKTQPLALSVRLDDGTLIAGLVGESFWNVLYVDILWVDEPYRRKGCGSALLRRAEAVAQQRLCEAVYLSTFTFQAPEFYSRQGSKSWENCPTCQEVLRASGSTNPCAMPPCRRERVSDGSPRFRN